MAPVGYKKRRPWAAKEERRLRGVVTAEQVRPKETSVDSRGTLNVDAPLGRDRIAVEPVIDLAPRHVDASG